MSVWQTITARRTEFTLLIAATVIIAVTLLNLNVALGLAVNMELLKVIGGFIGVFTIAHIALCFLAPKADQIMLPVAALVNGLGLAMVYRLDNAKETAMASRQVIWTLLGIILMLLVLGFLRDHRNLTRYSYIMGLAGLILLALPLVWPTDPAIVADARIWISIGPLTLQPGEFSKILLLLFFAQLLINKRALFNVAGYRFLGLEFPRLRDLGPILGVWAVAILIMAGENDFGPALLLFSTVLGMLYLATGRVSWLLIGAVLVALGGTAVYQISDKIQSRFSNFLDPIGNYEVTGYQLSQALFGMSTGGVTGSGLGQGYPYLVPVAESDFILAAVGEELGFIGLAAVLMLFCVFITRGMHTAMLTKDSYGKLVASGLSLTLGIQIFVVTAGITALMPMTGLTTPFMSQGGSSLMANYILLGIILRISDSSRAGSIAQEARS
ncbi:bacterial cell division membrane protein [Corynebacterium mustelae]|uniref:Bacterial cell division membrane protein n=1 Tax=Corynebacterium mustelae TaxID=571915 RepID=A0A0G3GXY9_9CORY|nr:FtsW/RodA/SpoVE family cell cycle protein [Corynebacterium mustelae]AKK04408.1 bacterial cell division membrane protein [Corynebacterium mustelae]